MNKLFMMGRLVADPEVRYGGANNTAVANFRLAVDRRFKRDGEPDADFFRITALGKQGEFVEKYLRKGTKVIIEGEIRNNNYTKDGQTIYSDQIIANSIEFAESKSAASNNGGSMGYSAPSNNAPTMDSGSGFMNIPDGIDEELPFN